MFCFPLTWNGSVFSSTTRPPRDESTQHMVSICSSSTFNQDDTHTHTQFHSCRNMTLEWSPCHVALIWTICSNTKRTFIRACLEELTVFCYVFFPRALGQMEDVFLQKRPMLQNNSCIRSVQIHSAVTSRANGTLFGRKGKNKNYSQ